MTWPDVSPLLVQAHLTGAEHAERANESKRERTQPAAPAGTDLSSSITCPNGHRLELSSAALNLVCDAASTWGTCGRPIRAGDVHGSCGRCDYDICTSCARRTLPQAGGAPAVERGDDDDYPEYNPGDELHIAYADADGADWYAGRIVRRTASGYRVRYDVDGATEHIALADSASRLRRDRPAAEATTDDPTPGSGLGMTSVVDRPRAETLHGDATCASPTRGSASDRRRGLLRRQHPYPAPRRGTPAHVLAACTVDDAAADGTATGGVGQGGGGRADDDHTDPARETSGGATAQDTHDNRQLRAQQAVFDHVPFLMFSEGDSVLEAQSRAEQGENGWVVTYRTPEGRDAKGNVDLHHGLIEDTIMRWRDLTTSTPTGSTMFEHAPHTGTGSMTVTTIGRSRPRDRDAEFAAWEAGMADALSDRHRDGGADGLHPLSDGTVYIRFGSSRGVGRTDPEWMLRYMPALARFASRAHAKYRCNVVVHRRGRNKTENRFGSAKLWTRRAEEWGPTAEALGIQGAPASPARTVYQGSRTHDPDVERTLDDVCDRGVDLFQCTSGTAEASDIDGVYAADGWTAEAEHKEPESEECAPGEGAVSAPVRFAYTQPEHERARSQGAMPTANLLYWDPFAATGATEPDRNRGATTDPPGAARGGRVGAKRARERAQQATKTRAAELEQTPAKQDTRSRRAYRGMAKDREMARLWKVAMDERATIEALAGMEDLEPTIRGALTGPLSFVWHDACLAELRSQLGQGAFRLVLRRDLPPGMPVMQSGWRLLLKHTWSDKYGHVPCRAKARFVCGGDSQTLHNPEEGVRGNYVYTSSPCPRPANVRWCLARSAEPGYDAYAIDVSGAFTNASAEFEGQMVMETPLFYAPDDTPRYPDGTLRRSDSKGAGPTMDREWDPMACARNSRSNARRRRPGRSKYVLMLHQNLYGLKQASRIWYLLWRDTMADLGFRASETDECLWYRTNPDTGAELVVLTHVDDSLVLTNDPAEKERFYDEVNSRFAATDEGSTTFFLGVRVARDEAAGTVTISQESLIDSMVEETEGYRGRAFKVPMEEGAQMGAAETLSEFDPTQPWGVPLESSDVRGLLPPWAGDEVGAQSRVERDAVGQYPYRRILGKMIHACTWSRPDIAYAVITLARYADPTRCRLKHVRAMDRVVRYLEGTRTMGITYEGGRADAEYLTTYVDADHGGEETRRASVSGYVVMSRGGAISWTSSRQKIAAGSSFESELIATRAVAAELLAMMGDYKAIEGKEAHGHWRIGCDNSAVIAVCNGGGSLSKRKHIQLRYFLIRRCVEEGLMVLKKVDTDWNPSDIFTKALGREKHHRFRNMVMNAKGVDREEPGRWINPRTVTM